MLALTTKDVRMNAKANTKEDATAGCTPAGCPRPSVSGRSRGFPGARWMASSAWLRKSAGHCGLMRCRACPLRASSTCSAVCWRTQATSWPEGWTASTPTAPPRDCRVSMLTSRLPCAFSRHSCSSTESQTICSGKTASAQGPRWAEKRWLAYKAEAIAAKASATSKTAS